MTTLIEEPGDPSDTLSIRTWLQRATSLFNRPRLPAFTVVSLPSTAKAGQMAYVSNEAGGAVPAFFDGTQWRRITDRNVVS